MLYDPSTHYVLFGMESLYKSIFWTLAAAVLATLTGKYVRTYRQTPLFAVPMVGADSGNISELKGRYVHEADVCESLLYPWTISLP